MRIFFTAILLSGLAVLAWFGYSAKVTFVVRSEGPQPPAEIRESTTTSMTGLASASLAAVGALSKTVIASTTVASTTAATTTPMKPFTHEELLVLADDKYAKGNVPLGDNDYITTGPKKGYVFLCNVHKDNPGSMVNGPWIHGTSWNFLDKLSIIGSVSWPRATFSNKVSGAFRILSGNGLPIGHTTGIFPVADNDPAMKYDKNPNTISIQRLKKQLPANPKFATSTPYCMGGEAGIMLTGIPLFNAFDAGLRDAPAHEMQDSCDGHPQGSGEYHYHNLSSCFKDIGVSTVLGYALDGFPITGPKVADKKFLTTENLDDCHGITSEVIVDGKKKMTYHYVMTRDFPYSVSCFRAKPVSLTVIQGIGIQGPGQAGMMGPQGSPIGGMPPAPPAQAIAACKGLTQGDTCSLSIPGGIQISGHCDTPPGQSLACIPH